MKSTIIKIMKQIFLQKYLPEVVERFHKFNYECAIGNGKY